VAYEWTLNRPVWMPTARHNQEVLIAVVSLQRR
jgi:hypothetical protein